jgi:putative addiction module component (TIGR02574 family)
MKKPRARIESLSNEERLELLERLWDSLNVTPSRVVATPAQLAELDRRSDAFDEDAAKRQALGVPWDEVVRQLRAAR